MSTTTLRTPDPSDETLPSPVTAGTTDPAPVSRPVNPPSGWAAPDLVDEEAGRHGWETFFAIALLVFISASDLIFIRSTFNVVLRDSPILSWILGASLTAAAVGLAFAAGALARKAYAATQGSRADALLATVLVVGWFLLGAAMFVLRWRAASYATTPVTYEKAAATSGLETHKEQLLAIILAGIYLATGALTFADAWKLTNPAAKTFRRVTTALARLRPLLAAQLGRVAHLRENLAVHEHQLSEIEARKANALASRRALADELKAHARVRIAVHLGDPAATGIVHPAGPARPAEPAPQIAHEADSRNEEAA